METKIKNLEQDITDDIKFYEYKTPKDELTNLYDNIATLKQMRLYQYSENFAKYFLNLEKQNYKWSC